MPTRVLPRDSSVEHLKSQASALIASCASADPPACQRLREFHPRFADASDLAISRAKLAWSDGLFAIAREYGFASWPRLKAQAEKGGADERSFRMRIEDPLLGEAVDALDDGDLPRLRALLAAKPDLVGRRAHFEGGNYFRTPSLLMFVAENPVRNDCLPPNIVDIARAILTAGASRNRADVDETLGLVASGRVAREAGAQDALIELLVEHGADPQSALDVALAHGEFGAVKTLIARGASMTLAVAAGLGDRPAVARLVDAASDAERHLAAAFAAQHGHAEILRILLSEGAVDPDRYNPPGAHGHSTPLHQAALNGHLAAVEVLLDHGARRDLRDALWNGTALDWARQGGQDAVASLLAADTAD